MAASTNGLSSLALEMMPDILGSKKSKKNSSGPKRDPMTLVDEARQLLQQAKDLLRGGKKDTVEELIAVIDNDLVASEGNEEEEEEDEAMGLEDEMMEDEL